jgi:PAS domain S-box-containing protein
MIVPVVLAIEDNPSILRLVRITLERAGYRVHGAETGAEARRLVAEMTPDLILSDLLLPDAHGLELVREFRSVPSTADVPVIAFSGCIPELDGEKLLGAGFTDILLKPAEPSRILEMVRLHLPIVDSAERASAALRKVLLLDDDLVELKYLRILLERQGYGVETATDCSSGLDRLRSEKFDLVVADVLMPGMTGLELCLAVRREPALAALPVVLISSCELDELHGNQLHEVGASLFVRKAGIQESLPKAILEALAHPVPAGMAVSAAQTVGEPGRLFVGQLERLSSLNRTLLNRAARMATAAAMLARMSELLARNTDLQQALTECLRCFLEGSEFSRGVVYLTGTDGSLVLRAAIGCSPEKQRDYETFFGHPELLSRVMETGELLVCPSMKVPEDVTRQIFERCSASALVLGPLSCRGEALGVLVVASSGSRIRDDALAFIQAALGQMSQAIALAQSVDCLAASERRYRLLYERANDGIVLLDSRGLILRTNPRLHQILGFRAEELLGRPYSEFALPEDVARYESLFEQLQRDGTLAVTDLRIRKAGGTFAWIDVSASLVGDRAPSDCVLMIRDVTARKEAEDRLAQSEAQLRQSQKMEAIGRLAGGVAHDFNNLLTVIDGYAGFILEGVAPGDPLHHDAEMVSLTVAKAAELTRQLLTFSRRQLIQPKAVALGSIMGGLEKMLRRLIGEDIDLTVEADRAAGTVLADTGQLEQVVMNLVVNARDAMPTGGRLRVRTFSCVRLDLPVTAGAEGKASSWGALEVSDSGCGMDEATQARIFEPFFTTKEQGKGTGLGLSTVYGITQQLGGRILVDSRPGEGTTFRILLPTVEQAPEQFNLVDNAERSLRGSETILLVEDEDAVREMTSRMLQSAGYAILHARHGGDALLAAEAAGNRIDLMVTDVVMPSLDGRQLALRLQPLQPHMKVLYMSGYTGDVLGQYGILDSGLAFLPKPFQRVELLRKVRDVLDA